MYDVHDAIRAFGLPYEPCDSGGADRYTYTEGSTAGGAVVYGGGLWLYSHHATDPAGGQLCNAWDLVRIHRFGELDDGKETDDPTKLPSYRAMLDLATKDARVHGEQIDRQFGDMGSIAPVSEETATTNDDVDTENDDVEDAGETEEEDPDAWKAMLTLNKKTGQPEATRNNASVIDKYAPMFKGRLAYCEMGGQIYVISPMPWKHRSGKLTAAEEKLLMGDGWMTTDDIYALHGYHGPPRMQGRVWDKQDRIELYKVFERWNYKVNQAANSALDDAVLDAAYEQKVNPIKDYLLGLKWDGTERLDTMFIRWLGAEDCALNRVVTRLWMMGAVDRALLPGRQFDSVLVFCGEQGIGKTSLLRMLAGEYYTNAVDATSMSKATGELLQGKWIVELGELDSVKKSSSTAFKNFITSTSDHYRKPYATDAEDFPRQCVFAATTNEGAFLRDDTGERRFWIMPCAGQKGMAELGKKGTLPGFAEEVEQLWAEAVVRWRERMLEMRRGGEEPERVNLYLYITDPELEAEMEERRQGFKLPDTDRELIEEYLDRPRPDNWESMTALAREEFIDNRSLAEAGSYVPQVVSLKEIRTELYGEDARALARGGRSSRAIRIASVMDSLSGWERVGRSTGRNVKQDDRSVRWQRK